MRNKAVMTMLLNTNARYTAKSMCACRSGQTLDEWTATTCMPVCACVFVRLRVCVAAYSFEVRLYGTTSMNPAVEPVLNDFPSFPFKPQWRPKLGIQSSDRTQRESRVEIRGYNRSSPLTPCVHDTAFTGTSVRLRSPKKAPTRDF